MFQSKLAHHTVCGHNIRAQHTSVAQRAIATNRKCCQFYLTCHCSQEFGKSTHFYDQFIHALGRSVDCYYAVAYATGLAVRLFTVKVLCRLNTFHCLLYQYSATTTCSSPCTTSRTTIQYCKFMFI